MLIAVGMYLPFETSSAIFVGGVLKWIVDRLAAGYDPPARARVEERGTLLASGLIAGEAIVGILLAATFLAGLSSFTRLLFGVDQLGFLPAWGGRLSLIGFAAVAYVLIRIPLQHKVTS